jgi:hypothetical protein
LPSVSGSVATHISKTTFRAGADVLGEALLEAHRRAAFTTGTLSVGPGPRDAPMNGRRVSQRLGMRGKRTVKEKLAAGVPNLKVGMRYTTGTSKGCCILEQRSDSACLLLIRASPGAARDH